MQVIASLADEKIRRRLLIFLIRLAVGVIYALLRNFLETDIALFVQETIKRVDTNLNEFYKSINDWFV